jgi:acyl carrier protein
MLEQLQKVFRKVFEDEQLVISLNTSEKDIKMWDSLTHLELIASIETAFNIRFSYSEVMEFNTVGDIINSIEKKN